MTTAGGNHRKIKLQNRLLVLKHIATSDGVSRTDIAKLTGLTKMTVSNLVNDLIDSNLVVEGSGTLEHSAKLGRNPISLTLSASSPCICGVSIKRGRCQIVLGDLSGKIFERVIWEDFQNITKESLVDFIKNGFTSLKQNTSRKIIAVGLSCIGPIDSVSGVVLNPPFFHGIESLHLVDIVREFTSLPVYLCNDGNAGALAELMYGAGRSISNFAYIHMMYGIGSGYVMEGRGYNGDLGQSGEIGHSTINFSGPKCSCGNTGCLELYANIANIRAHIANSAPFYPRSPLTEKSSPSLMDVVDAANQADSLAVSVLDEYLSYVAHAMTNIINFLDMSHIILDYSSTSEGTILEDILFRKISSSVYHFKSKNMKIIRSQFKGEAPLAGSIALVTDMIFNNQLNFE